MGKVSIASYLFTTVIFVFICYDRSQESELFLQTNCGLRWPTWTKMAAAGGNPW